MRAHGRGPGGHPFYRFGDPTGDALLIVPGVTAGIGWWNEPDRTSGAILEHYYFRAYREFDVWVMARPPGLPADADVATMAADYADAIADIAPVHVLGISLGGAIGAHLAAETDLVRRLVLVSCGVGLGPYGRETVKRWQALTTAGRYRALHHDYIRHAYARWRRLVVPPLYHLGERWLPEPPVRGDVARSCAALLAYDGQALDDVSVPSLVVNGREDALVPRASAREAATRLSCPLVVAPGGHGVYEESRRAVAATVVPFLAGERF